MKSSAAYLCETFYSMLLYCHPIDDRKHEVSPASGLFSWRPGLRRKFACRNGFPVLSLALTSEVFNNMHIQRARAAAFVIGSVAVFGTSGQGERSTGQENSQITDCQTAMPVILKQYNNARYAVEAARSSGDKGHIMTEVNQAQAALDAMEQPLKVCSDALQVMKSGQVRDGKS